MNVQDLLPITKVMYQQMSQLAWLLIGPLFLLSCVIEYAKEPHNFPAMILLRKLILTVVLLCIFPEITGLISTLSNELVQKISEKNALDVLYAQLKAQTDPKTQLSKYPFLLGADMNVSLLNYLSYALANLAKPIMVEAFHLLWSLSLIVGPLVMLSNLFRSAGHITSNLFRSMLEISCWNIVWAILGEMLLGLQFIHQPNNYFDVIGFNFLLVLLMVGTPVLVHLLVGPGLSSTTGVVASGASTLVNTPATVSRIIKRPFQSSAGKIAGKGK